YPFSELERSPIDAAEQQVFDILAFHVNEYLPNFNQLDLKTKKFSFRMLRSALERSPTEIRRIIQEILELPRDKVEELSGLLERTTLTSIINASKIVSDRLEFINGLEV